MPVYNVPIYGLIGSPEDENDKAKYFQYTDLLMHINNAKAFDTINLDIASDGGYVDVCDKMIEAIKRTGKFITTCNSGNVASAASKLFTLAPPQSRTFHPDKGCFLIHNPWGTIEGDSSLMADAAKELKATENDYAEWYALATGSDVEIIKAFMTENVPLTPEQVQSLGFATIAQPTIKAFAKLKSNTQTNMDNKEVVEKLNAFEKVLAKVVALFKIKAIMLADANGKELEFPDITDVSEIAIGVKVLENGAPANGEYPQPDGCVFKVENGILTEIVACPDPAGDPAMAAENAALKAELEALKAEKVTAEATVQASINEVKALKSEFTKFKAQFSNYKAPENTGDEPVKKNGFLSKDAVEKL